MKEKIKRAIQIIEDIFGDTSVDQQETVDALEELQEEIEARLDSLKC